MIIAAQKSNARITEMTVDLFLDVLENRGVKHKACGLVVAPRSSFSTTILAVIVGLSQHDNRALSYIKIMNKICPFSVICS